MHLSLNRTANLALVLVGPLLLACSEASTPQPVLEGELKTFIVDYENGDHRTGYALKTPSGRHVELEFSARPELEPGDWISIVGDTNETETGLARRDRSVGDELVRVRSFELVHKASDLGTIAQHLENGGTTTVTAAIVLLNFEGVAAQSFNLGEASNRLETVRNYYDEISYGMWDVQGDAFGPYTVAKPANCNLDTITNLARQAASNAGVAINDYDHVGVTLPEANGLSCACGLAWVGRSPAQGSPSLGDGSLYTCTGANAFTHEMGHGFGLHHASTANCLGVPYKRDFYDSCPYDEYGNQFNTMGNGLGHMNAFQKSTMKWLDNCNHVLVTRDATFELYPMQVATNQTQSLQVPNGDTRDGNPLYYYVEYRNPDLAAFNAMDGAERREKGSGVHVDLAVDFRKDGGDRRPFLLDVSETSIGNYVDPRLTPGRSFVDPDDRVTITVLDATAEKATVQVSFPGGGDGGNYCVDGSVPPPLGDPPPATLFQHCSYGGWYVALEPGEYTTADLVALGAFDNDASSIKLSEGYEADLFDGDNFTGTSVTITGNAQCLVDNTFNDVLSSIRIRALDDGSGGEGGAGPAGGSGGAAGSAGSAGTSASGGVAATAGSGGALATAGSSGNSAGGAPAPSTAGPGPQEPLESGCSCSVPGSAGTPATSSAWGVLALGALGMLIRRKGPRLS